MQNISKIPPPLKLKIVFLFIFSHISAYLLFLPSPNEEIDIMIDAPTLREGHTELSISASLKTSFVKDKAITIISKSNKLLIPHAFLLEKITEEINSDFSMETNKESYLVSIPTEFIDKVINRDELIILPYGRYQFSLKKKRRSYEIVL